MPVQRIWLRSADGTEKPLTAGPADTADYTPQVTPGGKHLIFLRLDRVDSGSLTELSLVTGKETSLGRLTGGPGFTDLTVNIIVTPGIRVVRPLRQ